jgi:ABC-2 type transport system permease protein
MFGFRPLTAYPGAIRALIRKELLAVWRDGKSRMVLIMPPLVQLFVFGFAATLEVRNVTLAVLDEDRSAASLELVARFEGAPTFTRILRLTHESEIAPVLDERRALAVLHVGRTFARDLLSGGTAKVQVLLDGRRSNAALILQGYVGEIIARFNAQWTAATSPARPPPVLVTRAWFNPNLFTRWAIVPGLIGILTMLIGLVVTALSVARERELGTLEQLLVTPLTPAQIMIGKTVPALIIGLAEGSVILAAAVWLFRIPFTGSLALLYLSLLVFLLAVIGMGLFISALVKTQQQAILGAFLFMVPAVILSGFATPINSMPEWLQTATLVNPLRHFLVIVRGLFLKDMGWDVMVHSLWPMALIALVTLPMAGRLFRRRLY